MPIAVHYDADEFGTALEVLVSEGDSQDAKAHPLEVRPGTALVVAVTGGLNGNRWTPQGTHIIVENPSRSEVAKLTKEQQVYAHPNPEPGTWHIRVIVETKSSNAQVSAAAVSHQMTKTKVKRPGWFRCNACKVMIKALVVAALFYLMHAAAVVAGAGAAWALLAKYAPALATAIASVVPKELLSDLADMLRDYVNEPLDRLLQRVCQLLGMCTPMLEPA